MYSAIVFVTTTIVLNSYRSNGFGSTSVILRDSQFVAHGKAVFGDGDIIRRFSTVEFSDPLSLKNSIVSKSAFSSKSHWEFMSSSSSFDNEVTASSVDAAKNWILHDPNPSTVKYVQDLIDTNDLQQLQVLFPNISSSTTSKRITFGTAGLRGKMLPGPFYMNDLVVIQTAQGIASYCKSLFANTQIVNDRDDSFEKPISSGAKRQRTNDDTMSHTGAEKLGVVIGYDHRATTSSTCKISSLQFALYTTLVFKQAGFDDVFLIDGYVATPIVPFVLGLHSTYTKSDYKKDLQPRKTMMIGIMITASHNPKDDAGYKIYWSDGCQIRSPVDKHISSHIEQNLAPWVDYSKLLSDCRDNCDPNDPCFGLSDPERTKVDTIPAYFDALVSAGLVTGQVSKWNDNNTEDTTFSTLKPPTICYTAMHGVGYKFAKHVLSTTYGIPKFYSVPEQQETDPNFPTVLFPNPEEKGALNMAKAHAELHNCDIILANDPDADRLAVAERDRTTGKWTEFTGDQIGAMLGHWLWQNYKDTRNKYPNTVAAMCASTVSSRLLAEIARIEGFYYEDTLTGFKWIGSRAAELHKSQVKDDPTKTYHTIFCYEEAIGTYRFFR